MWQGIHITVPKGRIKHKAVNNILPYNDYGRWLSRKFPYKVQKISVDAGFSCPNRDGKISRGTVYRNLAELASQGEVTHARIPGADRYDLRQDQHYHLYCTRCGQVMDAPIAYRPEDDAAVEQATGFRITRHRLVFEGLCPACAAANHKSAPREELSDHTNHEGGITHAPEQVCRHPDGEEPSRSL